MARSEIIGTLILVCCLIVASYGASDAELSQRYRFSKVMDANNNYKLYWSFNRQAKTIAFAVRVGTAGWVGFGLSPNGQMPNSDVVIGWVDSNGIAHFHDRRTTTRSMPNVDESQDWFLVRGEEETEFGYKYTTLEFTRNLTSCDANDRDIKPETQRVIWSYNNNDPANENSVPYHEDRGSVSLNLLGGLETNRTIPSDSKSFFVRNKNLAVPGRDTTYWCSNHFIFNVTGKQLWDEEIYIYKAKPVITPENLAHIHHMMVFLCPTYSNIETDGICNEVSTNFFGCFGGEILGAWAVGGQEFVFPEDVAFPIYIGPDTNRPYKLLLEMHYDRTPAGGIVDNSGMEFFYTKQKPKHLAGTFTVSIGVIPTLIIPPKAEKFTVRTTCASSCTDQNLPESGVTVFASFLHSHLIGRGLTVKHFRKANDTQCDAVEELEPIDENLTYDFDFQQLNHLQKHVQVKKGDTISLECHYRSTGRTNVTLGGEGTREEMCQSMLIYYPRSNLSTCGTYADAASAYRPFLNKYYFGQTLEIRQAEEAINTFYREGINTAFNWINWTDEAIKDLQNSVNNATIEREVCGTNRNSFPVSIPLKPRFVANCTYEAPDKCTGQQPQSCCARLQSPLSSM